MSGDCWALIRNLILALPAASKIGWDRYDMEGTGISSVMLDDFWR